MNDATATAARESVLVVPAEDRAAIVVRGKDRTTWLNGLVTQDLVKLAAGDAAYALLVEKKGKIQTDLYVVPGPDALLLAVPAALRAGVLATLDHYLIMEDAEVAAEELTTFFAVGPRAAELTVAVGAPFSGALDLLGTGGAILAGGGLDVAAAARALGGAVGDESTWAALSVERGLGRFGVDFDTSLYPQEASLEARAVSFQKGCYLGQEVVYMLQERGHVKRKLVPLDVEGDEVPANGAEVATVAGEVVGEVKSAARGPLTDKTCAIAMVKWAETKPGTELRVAGRVARVR